MKRFSILFAFVFIACFTLNVCIADGFEKITSNPTISASLRALLTVNRSDVISILNGNNATKQPIRVMFRNMAMYGAADCEALTTKTRSGSLVIFINEQHKDAPVEAIACLIAHESQHHTFTSTRAEEFRAWVSETTTWNAFVRKDKTVAYSSHPLVKRENYIAKLYVKQDGAQAIKSIIAKNPVYKNYQN